MKFELIEVSGLKGALLGMRLPMNKDLEGAKEKSDSGEKGLCDCLYDSNGKLCTEWVDEPCSYDACGHTCREVKELKLGESDKKLCQTLINADSGEKASGHGQPNSKFLRMIHAQICVTAPLYWWKEADTYKVGTTSNSTSTMHRIANYPITMDCFEMDDFEYVNCPKPKNDITSPTFSGNIWVELLDFLERLRQKYNETKDKRYWKELIRLLPESWLQTRMLDVDYQTLRNIYFWRKNHKLTEWHSFCKFIETLPESWLITE